MLYDPKWEQEVKSDPFSMPSIISWLGTMPADREYVWSDTFDSCRGGCLIHQYLRAHDRDPVLDYQRIASLETCGPHRFFDGDVAMEQPFTFGAALERAKAFSAVD